MPLVAQSSTKEANVKESIKFSGQLMLHSSTTSSLTGRFFSLYPGVRAQATASYRSFSLTAGRNVDLINSYDSDANMLVFNPSFRKSFGDYTLIVSAETFFFDQSSNLEMVVPALNFTRRGSVNVELFVLWGICHRVDYDLFSQRLSISKDHAGYTFRLTGWNVNFVNTHRMAISGEISKRLNDNFRITVASNYHHNLDNETTDKFGVVRLTYSF